MACSLYLCLCIFAILRKVSKDYIEVNACDVLLESEGESVHKVCGYASEFTFIIYVGYVLVFHIFWHLFTSRNCNFLQGLLFICFGICWCAIPLQSWSLVHFFRLGIYTHICGWGLYHCCFPQSVCSNWMGKNIFLMVYSSSLWT